MAAHGSIIQRKLRVPEMPQRRLPRPRVERLLAELIEAHGVLCVYATAGAGKTTAVVEALSRTGRPPAWLTIADSDAAPGRLLTYLEAALATAVPAVGGVVAEALAARIPHAEVAGLLADALGESDVVLVLDELEQLAGADEALAVIGGFLRQVPPTIRVVLISRRDLPLELGAAASAGQLAGVGERDLAFDVPEAAAALSLAGADDIDPKLAVEATGGWVTGVLYEAWRSAEHILGMGGEADPLNGYLSSQILQQLAPEERDFLVCTSILDQVDPGRARAIGQIDAGGRLWALRAAHLPVGWDASDGSMRCHPRFRQYLLEQLERRDEDEVRALRAAHGRLLAREGHLEEAVEELLRARDLTGALGVVEQVIGPVIDRLDLALAERWIEQLAPVEAEAPFILATAELMLAIAHEDYRRGIRVADRLQELGLRDELVRTSPRAASLMAWCYWHTARTADMRRLIELAPPSPEVEAMRYCLSLSAIGEPSPPAPPPTASPLDAVLVRIHYYRGQLALLADVPETRWAAKVAEPWRMGGLRAMGRTREALEYYESVVALDGGGVWSRALLGPELMGDLGRREQAWLELMRGRERIRASGSIMLELVSHVLEAKLELRLNRDPHNARVVLDRVLAHPALVEYGWVREQVDVWYGLALLLTCSDEEALSRLRGAVESMHGAGRLLELPAAGVYLAEAEWRQGNEEEADRAADVALAAAAEQGTNHMLLQALTDFPAVVSRRLDAEPGADSPWHALGRTLRAQSVLIDAPVQTVIELAEFGRIGILVNGREVSPKISKSSELLAYLVQRGAERGGVDKDELLDALFDSRSDDSARSYLRQAVRRLREVLPEDVSLAVEPGHIALNSAAVMSESLQFERLIAEASRLRGEQRLELTMRALRVAARGDYLPGLSSRWVDERREQLSERIDDARLEAAELAFDADRYAEAEELVRAVLRHDSYREAAWRLLMRISGALGDQDKIITAFRQCQDSLLELGAEPSPATRELLQSLRR